MKTEQVFVLCPECRTRFVRPRPAIGIPEKCGICLNEVLMLEVKQMPSKKVVLGGVKKAKNKNGAN